MPNADEPHLFGLYLRPWALLLSNIQANVMVCSKLFLSRSQTSLRHPIDPRVIAGGRGQSDHYPKEYYTLAPKAGKPMQSPHWDPLLSNRGEVVSPGVV
jgi:hypothetical protein